MITDRVILRNHNWAVTILYKYNCSDIPEILDHLNSIGYLLDLLSGSIQTHLKNNNKGLIYSNPKIQRCIVVLNESTILNNEDALIAFICDNIIDKLM